MNGATDIDTILAQFPRPVRLAANKGMQKVVLIGCLVFEFVLAKSLVRGEGTPSAVLIVMAVVLWQLLRCALVIARRDGLELTLDRDGFTIRYPLRARTLAWTEAGDFIAAKSRAPLFNRTLFNNRSADKSMMERARGAVGMLRFGRDAALPDTYNFGADRLARLLTLWQQRALAK